MRKIIWTALSAAVALMAIGPSTSAALDCSAQPLGDCSQILIGLPYLLQFDDGSAGQILDSVGQGTGFTFLDPRGDGGGYLPANLLIHGGRLEVTTTDGTAEGASNTQDNELGVGIDAPSQVTRIQVTIENPDIGTGASEQAGLWFGNDQDNQVALTLESTADGPRVGFSLQDSGATAPGLEQSPVLSFDPGQTLTLILIIDPETRRIEARYRIGDQGAESSLGTGLTAPGEFFSFDAAGIDPLIGTNSFGGIFATQGSTAPPLTYYFDDFQVSKERDVGVPPTDLTSQGIAFKRASFPVPNPTSMVFGPDGRLYVSELLGPIHALTLNADHQPIADQVINTLGTRLTLGLAIDPHSTPGNVILWASHSSPDLNAGEENSSTVSRLSGPGFANREDVITGLPRAVANHSVNSIHFGPDGRLYIAVGGNTGAGAPNDDPDSMAEFGQRPEQPLSAALLVADVGAPGFQGDCATPAGQFGPPPSSCDVHTYATGFRNMYDFVFHSNGAIYGPDNGLGITGTFPPSPAPDCTGLADPAPWNGDPPGDNPGIQPDELNRIVQDGYYGHPDPYRNECVFGDGSWQGVTPPPNYQPPILDLGDHRSADGTIEYTSSAGCGSLKGNLVLSNFSVGDNLTRIELSSDGRSVVRSQTLADGFNDPLPLAQGPDGTIYVGEFTPGLVTALVPDNIGCWRDRAKLPVDLLDAGGAALGGKLYVVGGKDAVAHRSRAFAYDPRFDHWFRVPSLPGPAVENPAVVARGGRLYVIGGSTEPFSGAVARVTSYDPHRNRWRSLTPMPTPRGGATAQVLGGKIYVAGGLDASGASLSRVEVFDPSDGPTGSWSSAPPMSVRRDNPGSAALSGRLYVFGGRTRNADGSTVDGALTSVEMYDPSTGDWKSRASMPTGRRTMAVGTLNGRAQLIGGEGSAVAPGTFYANEEYDPATDSWRTLTSMPTPRHGAAAGTIGGVVYTVGGGPQSGSSFSRLNQAFSFAPFGNPAPLPRCHGHPATIVGDSGPNRLAGTKRTDVIVAKAGRDLIHGYGGRDVICGGGGRDRLLGGGGRDLLLGQGGADRLFGGRAADRLVGGAAGDWLFGGPGPDRLFGGRRDRLFGGRGRDFCALGRSGVRAGCERPR